MTLQNKKRETDTAEMQIKWEIKNALIPQLLCISLSWAYQIWLSK